jgi:alanine racemase
MLEGSVTWAEVDLDAIAFNVRAFKRHVGERVEIFAVVKANAYGHGAIPVARAALEAGASRLAVHRTNEGVELRRGGVSAPILVMGYTPPAPRAVEMIVRHDLTPSLITREFAEAVSSEASRAGKVVSVHVKVDTGMSRYGLLPGEVVDFCRSILALPGIQLEGLFTHLATADSANLMHTLWQLETFRRVMAAVEGAGIHIPLRHAANSAAAMKLTESHLDVVRLGIAMYGMDPSDEWPPTFEIRPALALKSCVSRVRVLPPGSGVSYGRTFITERETPVALVPVGYGDGYHRVLSNKGSVLIHGQRAPIRGRVCMDQFVVDITGIEGVRQDDEVVVVGRQGEDEIRAEEVARLAGTINYEVTTSLLPRVTRVYKRGRRVVGAAALDEESQA